MEQLRSGVRGRHPDPGGCLHFSLILYSSAVTHIDKVCLPCFSKHRVPPTCHDLHFACHHSENVVSAQEYVLQHFEKRSVHVANQRKKNGVTYHRVRLPTLSGASGVHASTTALKLRLKDYPLLSARNNGGGFALRISAAMVV